MNRKFVYIFDSPNSTVNVVNYDAGNSRLNSFLWLFDIWNQNGHFKISEDGENSEVWFECSGEFKELVTKMDMQEAFKRMGVQVVFEYPF